MWRAATFKPPPLRHRAAVGGQGCAARRDGYGPRIVRCVRHVMSSRMVSEGVDG